MGFSIAPFLVAGLLTSQPLTLDDCVKIALEHNLTLRQLSEQVRAATAEYQSSWSNFLPTLTVSGGYSRYRTETPWPGGYYTLEDTSWSASFQLSQTLFDSERFALSARLRAQKEVSEMEFTKERLNVSLKAKEDYYNLFRMKKLRQVSETRLKESEKNLEKTEQLHRLGSASRAALLKAKVDFLEAQLEAIKASKNVELAKSNLLITLGFGPSEEIVLEEDSLIELKEPPSYEVMLELASRHSPKLRSAKANLGLAKANLYASYGAYLPKLSFSATYGYQGRYAFPLKQAWDEGRKDWRFGLTISVPIFTGFQRYLSTNKRSAELRSAEHYREIVERNLRLELENSYLTIEESTKRLELAEEAFELAQESYEAAKERYDLGAAPILELIDAELSLVKAESARIEAFYDYRLGIERLKAIVGKEDI
ncbi:hypothetical protein AMJ40_00825 [candidate division TA06 bacterium DG_26]|uniref:Transporter n=1 Tax=candidate division TA06 bacterium DG_26 TaxID=1703771 RepID=A0A0S7WLX6_UNCT6|nr:MAG: hypothetical protein AMJ40_00825 [candidate division TA06 bacterium DG_26]